MCLPVGFEQASRCKLDKTQETQVKKDAVMSLIGVGGTLVVRTSSTVLWWYGTEMGAPSHGLMAYQRR